MGRLEPTGSVMDRIRAGAAALVAAGLFLGAANGAAARVAEETAAETAKFEKDRAAILAMAGDYEVTFDFTETVSFAADYEPKAPYVAHAEEIVRVIEDRGGFISLQHILVVGDEDARTAIKHWRQDWTYEPKTVLDYVGGAAWSKRKLSAAERAGAWSQVVYQVDDAPRYGAVAPWRHENGVSAWTSPANMRPLPRRDATKRDDYDAILAVNRHALTPAGWVHEQDNSKLVLRGAPRILAREVGVNTYEKSEDVDAAIADAYWEKTKDFWAGVRKAWARLEAENKTFALTIQGEPAALYEPILEIADAVAKGEKEAEAAVAEAKTVIAAYTTTDPAPLADRLATTPKVKQAQAETGGK